MKTQYIYDRPWPEAIAGAVIGFQLGLGLALVPPLTRFVEDPAIAPIILAVSTILGALASWWIAGRSIGVTKQRLQAPVTLEREKRRAA